MGKISFGMMRGDANPHPLCGCICASLGIFLARFSFLSIPDDDARYSHKMGD